MNWDLDSGDKGSELAPEGLPTGAQHWELGGGLQEAYLIVAPGERLVLTHLGGGSYYFTVVPALKVDES